MTPAGDAVHAAVADLAVPFRLERSVKLRPGRLEADRFLVSVERRHLGDPVASRGAILAIAERLGFPAPAIGWLRRFEREAGVLHLGHEAAAGRVLCKLYLENPAARSGADAACGQGAIVHRALKWDAAAGLLRETLYRLAPHAELGSGPLAESAAAALARDLLARAERAGLGEAVVLLDVVDEASTRRSFDLQVYDLALRRADCADGLSRLERLFALPDGALAAVLPERAVIGHLAGGWDGDGSPFATLYHGARWR